MPDASTLCVVHGGVDEHSAINRIAKHTVIAALDAGWEVTVIAKDLEPGLADRVSWRRLFVPPRLHAVQWISARQSVKRALGADWFDSVIGWQAQLIGLLDVYHCGYLSEPARESSGFAPLTSPRSASLRAQQEIVTVLEARCFRRWDQETLMVYTSQLIKREFEQRYPTPDHQALIENFGPAPNPASVEERAAARIAFGLAETRGPVLAFLGGFDARKGVHDVVDELRGWPEAVLLLAGPDFGARPADLPSNVMLVGRVDDVRQLLAAADVLVVPSRFDPFAVVVLEAAAAGTPAIVTPEVGAKDALLRYEAGLAWDRDQPLRGVVTRVIHEQDHFRRGALAMANALRDEVFRAAVLEQLRVTAGRKSARRANQRGSA